MDSTLPALTRVPHVSPLLRDVGAALQLSAKIIKADMTHFILFTTSQM